MNGGEDDFKLAKKKADTGDDFGGKFTAMKVTKSVKRRHQGLLLEIEKEIQNSEKFLQEGIHLKEALKLKRALRKEAKEKSKSLKK